MAVKQSLIQRIDRADKAAIIQAIIADGCCIIQNFTEVETVKQVNSEVQPYLDADKPWKGDLFPPETRRCANLAGRSQTARERWLIDPLIRSLTAHFVDKTTSNFYGETKHTYTSEAICSIAMSFDIGPGAKAQRLHRDDKNFHVDHEDQSTTGYRVGSDVMMAFMVPGVKTTVENGATIAIPGSHLWGSDRAPRMDEAVVAEMDPSDCWVMLGGLYHAGGANVTQSERRVVHGMFFTRGFYRQEENAYLANTADDVLSWSPAAQRVMGYELSSPNIGFVGFQTPLQYLRVEGVGDAFGDFDPSQEQPNRETH
ncbi:phytanoyl-CoA dioxygenase family protein [Aspergillus ibericus CBS 121593]|uniref:Phytanoyl-CoA dioxygenase family protein n=1 Tax=Aspergillus ibericus CBS 121593 TaxID=1448316 RepID=A0A395H6R3_9EURO|nr:phytanoyl-CoA dioxygenase family protein [Aspergillus ibericus CBS 121593]RAL03203.1 phytanoyl-CoA dioxygenase family protein [Aspergillus ibericus CBS 121593]